MLKHTVKKYFSEDSNIHRILATILTVMPIFSYGTGVGWLSPMGPVLVSQVGVEPETISWMASVVFLVATPAVFFFGYIVDTYGRKKALMFTSFCLAICWSLKLYSTRPWVLILARGVLGFGTAGSYVVTPLYMKEISEDSMRGTLGSLVILSQNLGNLLVYILGEYLSYYGTLWVCLVVPLLHLLFFTTMPETPSFLLKSGKYEEARDALAWLRCRQSSDTVIDGELQTLLTELEQSKSSKFSTAFKTIGERKFQNESEIPTSKQTKP
ncbi:sugar transporter domain-containing protein [Phthorimaea operculella]|nr:sugar transporter domain-containing protein [Phthorimaea operculella]